jgi:hypothetical protein
MPDMLAVRLSGCAASGDVLDTDLDTDTVVAARFIPMAQG